MIIMFLYRSLSFHKSTRVSRQMNDDNKSPNPLRKISNTKLYEKRSRVHSEKKNVKEYEGTLAIHTTAYNKTMYFTKQEKENAKRVENEEKKWKHFQALREALDRVVTWELLI